jgi:AraC-like DNA-binding protein
MLTLDDVARLNFPNVTFHTKGVLAVEEMVQALQQTFSGEVRLRQPTSLLVKQALAYLHQNYTQAITRSQLAVSVGVSDTYLSQIFRQELGLSPMECLNRLRIQKARELLRASDEAVTAIAAKVGFDDPAYFSRVFRKLSGCSPQVYRQGG